MNLFWATVQVICGVFFSLFIGILALFLLTWVIDYCYEWWLLNHWRVITRYKDWLRRQQRRYGR